MIKQCSDPTYQEIHETWEELKTIFEEAECHLKEN